ncbi:unnamed protein product [Urochloa humidicola]
MVPAEQLSSYKAACRLEPELRTFYMTLQRRTSCTISTVTVGMEARSLSLDSLREVAGRHPFPRCAEGDGPNRIE